MATNYSIAPYNKWYKCPHTCVHPTVAPIESHRNVFVKNLAYEVDGVVHNVLEADHIYPSSQNSLVMHTRLAIRHPACSAECPGNQYLGKDDGLRLTTTQIRRALTPQDWKEFGVSLAVLYSFSVQCPDIPDEYYQEACRYLEGHLTVAQFSQVQYKRNQTKYAPDAIVMTRSTGGATLLGHQNEPPLPPPSPQRDSPPSQRDSTPSQRDSPPSQRDSTPSQRDSTPSQRDSTPSQRESPPFQRDSPPFQRDSTPPPSGLQSISADNGPVVRPRSFPGTHGSDLPDRVTNLYDVAVPHELAPQTPQLRWSNSLVTAGPFIPDPQDPSMNLLEDSFRQVEEMTRWPNSTTSDFVVHLDFSQYANDTILSEACREQLKHGRTVVIENYPHSNPQEFETCLGNLCLVDRRNSLFTVHDSLQRSSDSTTSTQQLTLDEFVANTTEHDKIQTILALTLGRRGVPSVIERIDDGYLFGYANVTIGDVPLQVGYQEILRIQNWALAHHGGVFTSAHHDADGMGTHCQVVTGNKQWTVLRPAGWSGARSREELDAAHKKVWTYEEVYGNRYNMIWRQEADMETSVIDCQPGDFIIMPPGTLHEVYTPVRTVATGGHYISYDTLHLTEMSRAVDHKHGQRITNDVHIVVHNLLSGMMMSIAHGYQRPYHLKCLQALCKMLVYPQNYFASTGNSAHTRQLGKMVRDAPVSRSAAVEAEGLMSGMGWDLSAQGRDYLFAGDGPWYDPGSLVSSQKLQEIFQSQDPSSKRPSDAGSSNTNKRRKGNR
ncbi:hypothetical protein C0991_007447 [Blastosporella zonata]|nr:hypothetical protein C0991_007447 [Blastosporella zonata]